MLSQIIGEQALFVSMSIILFLLSVSQHTTEKKRLHFVKIKNRFCCAAPIIKGYNIVYKFLRKLYIVFIDIARQIIEPVPCAI